MRDVFIVEAVRTPLGKRGGGLATVHPADLLGSVQKAAVERAKLDPAAVDQVVERLRLAGRRAVVQHRPHGVALGRACPIEVAVDHGRFAVRLEPAGDHLRDRPRRGGARRSDRLVRRREHEPHPARRELRGQEARPAGAEELLRALRVQQPVPGRRDDRAGVRHHARGRRPFRPAQPAERGARLEGRPLRPRSARDRRAGRGRRGQADRRARADHARRRRPRLFAREARHAEGRDGRRHPHRGHRVAGDRRRERRAARLGGGGEAPRPHAARAHRRRDDRRRAIP